MLNSEVTPSGAGSSLRRDNYYLVRDVPVQGFYFQVEDKFLGVIFGKVKSQTDIIIFYLIYEEYLFGLSNLILSPILIRILNLVTI